MRRLSVAVVLTLGVATGWPRLALAQDAPVSKEQADLDKQKRELEEQREKDAQRRLDDEKRAAAEKQKAVDEREKELDKLRPQRIPTPYVDPPDLAFGPFGSTALTMQSPRPRTRVYLAMDGSGWSHADGYPYHNRGWGVAGRAGGELAFGRLSFGGDVPWLYYTKADTDRLGFGDFSLFTKLHIFGAGKYDAKSYFTSMLRLTFPTHFPKEKWDAANTALNGDGYPAADDFYTKIEIAALVGHTLARRFSFGAQGGLVVFVGTGDLGNCRVPTATGTTTPYDCRAESHVGFDGHAHIGIRIIEALDLHVQAGGVVASAINFANGGYVGGSLNLNLGSFRISAGAVVPLNAELQRVYKWIATLSLSWELHQYKRPQQNP